MSAIILSEQLVFSQIPQKGETLNKYSAGRVFLVAGSRAYPGAALLCAIGALHSGCGYLTLASVVSVCRMAVARLLTPTVFELPETPDGAISQTAAEVIGTKADSYHALALGPGLSLCEDTRELVYALLRGYDGTLILDADGINALSKRIEILREAPGQVIITPHEGEMARLCRCSVQQISQNRRQAALGLAKEYGITVVLKGPHTLIAAPDGTLYENRTGNCGLAKAGSGDVLTGIIASLAAQGAAPLWAAACGVYLHGSAADLAAQDRSVFCMQPSHLTDYLPAIFLRNGR